MYVRAANMVIAVFIPDGIFQVHTRVGILLHRLVKKGIAKIWIQRKIKMSSLLAFCKYCKYYG